jgi:cell division septal protein FtsQ
MLPSFVLCRFHHFLLLYFFVLLDFLLAAAYSFAKVRIEGQNVTAKETKLNVKNK